ncbi:MAG: hypothetical protein ACRD96_21045, partial [Bryobacteraceae bacterium]
MRPRLLTLALFASSLVAQDDSRTAFLLVEADARGRTTLDLSILGVAPSPEQKRRLRSTFDS